MHCTRSIASQKTVGDDDDDDSEVSWLFTKIRSHFRDWRTGSGLLVLVTAIPDHSFSWLGPVIMCHFHSMSCSQDKGSTCPSL